MEKRRFLLFYLYYEEKEELIDVEMHAQLALKMTTGASCCWQPDMDTLTTCRLHSLLNKLSVLVFLVFFAGSASFFPDILVYIVLADICMCVYIYL